MADKIVVMHDGLVEQIGAPLELYDRPANLFVAGFIGSPAMNMLKGKIKAGVPAQFVSDSGTSLPIGEAPQGSDGRPVVFGIRPEHFSLDPNGTPAEVVVVEPTGAETHVVVLFAGQEVTCVFRERVSAKPGETLRISVNPNVVHLFDAESGRRL